MNIKLETSNVPSNRYPEAPDPKWRWRKSDGTYVRPAMMGTTHLYNTVRTIWNSHCPTQYRLPGGSLYSFGPLHYPKEYLAVAFNVMMAELDKRDDRSVEVERGLKSLHQYAIILGVTTWAV